MPIFVGGYLEDLQTAPVLSDQETIKTEDFEARFNECLIPAAGNVNIVVYIHVDVSSHR